MATRKDRLKNLVRVQEQLKAFHETRRAGFLAEAAAAENEAAELANRIDAEGSLSALFPDLYANRIGKALARKDMNIEKARGEAGLVATATARTNMVVKAYREARRLDERDTADRERLELIQRHKPQQGN